LPASAKSLAHTRFQTTSSSSDGYSCQVQSVQCSQLQTRIRQRSSQRHYLQRNLNRLQRVLNARVRVISSAPCLIDQRTELLLSPYWFPLTPAHPLGDSTCDLQDVAGKSTWLPHINSPSLLVATIYNTSKTLFFNLPR
jgi:hypothetical protein